MGPGSSPDSYHIPGTQRSFPIAFPTAPATKPSPSSSFPAEPSPGPPELQRQPWAEHSPSPLSWLPPLFSNSPWLFLFLADSKQNHIHVYSYWGGQGAPHCPHSPQYMAPQPQPLYRARHTPTHPTTGFLTAPPKTSRTPHSPPFSPVLGALSLPIQPSTGLPTAPQNLFIIQGPSIPPLTPIQGSPIPPKPPYRTPHSPPPSGVSPLPLKPLPVAAHLDPLTPPPLLPPLSPPSLTPPPPPHRAGRRGPSGPRRGRDQRGEARAGGY